MSAVSEAIPPRFRLDRRRYHQMIDAGIFVPEDRIELIHGELVKKMTLGGAHIRCVNRLNMHFAALGIERVVVSVQNAIQIDDHNEPESDIVLLRPDYEREPIDTPMPADVLLVVEVADTSLLYDREVKLPLYAQAAIPEFWLVDLHHQAVFVYREPADGTYGDMRRRAGADKLAPLAFPDHRISVEALLR